MPLQEKKQITFQFFDHFIGNFIVKDLEVLSSIKPDAGTGLAGCAIPTAMAVISAMELLGFLLKPNGRTGDSKENITFFIKYNNRDLFPDY